MTALGRRQDAAVERARRRGAARCSPAPRRATSSSPSCEAARPMLETQARLSRMPDAATRCWSSASTRARASTCSSIRSPAATCTSGLGSLLAWRLARDAPNTFSIVDQRLRPRAARAREPVDPTPLVDQQRCSTTATCCTTCSRASTPASWRSGASARSRASPGWSSTGYPGQPKSTRQLQASSALFYEVFRKYDAGNLLLAQAESEVLSQELDIARLRATLGAHARAARRLRRADACRARSRCR